MPCFFKSDGIFTKQGKGVLRSHGMLILNKAPVKDDFTLIDRWVARANSPPSRP